ncbi:nucleoside phosphatase GDA1/CD39, partial [Cantharellus anzutake]
MPPPTASDLWLTSRRFGLVIDAGSSGSRLQIYSWKDARSVRQTLDLEALDRLPQVEKGVPSGDDWLHKVEPGISSFAQNPMGIPEYLAPLLEHAKDTVPPSLHRETPIFLLATAGMRLLPKDQQNSIIEATCMFFRANSSFRLEAPSIIGPCGSSVRIISGEEEGIFGWISVNYLMDGFTGHDQHHRGTYGFLDMGGASTQIAFEPGPSERESMSHTTADTLIDVRLRLLSGEEIEHPVFVTTWLGYGTNQARERYIGSQVKNWLSSGHGSTNSIPDPCLPKQLNIPLSPQAIPGTDAKAGESHELIGTGSFEQCLVQTAPLLNNDRPCPDVSCLFNGVPAPRIDFSLSKFIGVSEYWYSSEHVFGLGGAYDVVQYERAAIEFCSREWSDIVQEHKETHFDEFGKPIPPGTWGKEVGLNRLQLQCFKAAWVVNVLHQGIGLPRIVDSGGNQTTGEAGSADEKAKAKGLGPNLVGPATFQSVDTIGDTAVSWTLGKMVLEASKEVPP